jgi:excisionase family DNA binding protein
MNIKEAAEYLGISVKTLERKIAGGEIAVAYVPGATGKQRTFDRAELDRFKAAEAERLVATTYVMSKSRNFDAPSTPHALQRAGGEQGMQAFALMVADALQGRQTPGTATGRAVFVELKDKLTLSFKEASRLSGVPESHLRIAYANGKLRGAKIGRGVRVSPDALKAYVAKILK